MSPAWHVYREGNLRAMVYGMYIQHSLEIKSPWNWLDLLPRTRVCWYVLLTVSINNRTRSGIYKHWYISHSRICLLYPEVNLQTPSAQGHKAQKGDVPSLWHAVPWGRAGRPYGMDHVCPSGTSQRAVFHLTVHSARQLFSSQCFLTTSYILKTPFLKDLT